VKRITQLHHVISNKFVIYIICVNMILSYLLYEYYSKDILECIKSIRIDFISKFLYICLSCTINACTINYKLLFNYKTSM